MAIDILKRTKVPKRQSDLEPVLKVQLALLCMAAVMGDEPAVQKAQREIIEFARSRGAK